MIVALDLDGTLITAHPRQMLLLKAVATRYGTDLDAELIWNLKRSGATNSQALIACGINDEKAEVICRSWVREIESAYWLMLDTLFIDALDALATLKLRGFELVLITARQNEYLMRQQIARLGIDRFLDHIHCVSPARAVLEKSKILNTLKPKAFFGDTETDFQSSCAADVPFYGLSTGQRSADFLLKEGLHRVWDSFESSTEQFFLEHAQSH